MNRFGVRILVGIAGVGRSASIAQPGQEVWPAALAVWGIALAGGEAGGRCRSGHSGGALVGPGPRVGEAGESAR